MPIVGLVECEREKAKRAFIGQADEGLAEQLRAGLAVLHLHHEDGGIYANAYSRGWHAALNHIELLLHHYGGKLP